MARNTSTSSPYDGVGVATTTAFDFKGNALAEERQLALDKTTQPDWTDLLAETTIAAMATAASPLLDAETFSASSQRDALNRVLVAISPDDSEVLYTYDEGGALQKVEVKHRGSSTAQTVVGDITYNARGQRESVTYGPTSSPTTITTYTYDPLTYRLSQLTTVRDSDDATLQSIRGDCCGEPRDGYRREPQRSGSVQTHASNRGSTMKHKLSVDYIPITNSSSAEILVALEPEGETHAVAPGQVCQITARPDLGASQDLEFEIEIGDGIVSVYLACEKEVTIAKAR